MTIAACLTLPLLLPALEDIIVEVDIGDVWIPLTPFSFAVLFSLAGDRAGTPVDTLDCLRNRAVTYFISRTDNLVPGHTSQLGLDDHSSTCLVESYQESGCGTA